MSTLFKENEALQKKVAGLAADVDRLTRHLQNANACIDDIYHDGEEVTDRTMAYRRQHPEDKDLELAAPRPPPPEPCPKCDRLQDILRRVREHWDDGMTEAKGNAGSWVGTMRDILDEAPRAPPPEPCPKCGGLISIASSVLLRQRIWECDSLDDGDGFQQSVPCELRQLRAACKANGMMNGDWPVVVGKTTILANENGRLVEATIASVNQSGRVELVGASGWVFHRKPSELWHSRPEADAAMAKGGGG